MHNQACTKVAHLTATHVQTDSGFIHVHIKTDACNYLQNFLRANAFLAISMVTQTSVPISPLRFFHHTKRTEINQEMQMSTAVSLHN